MYIIFERGKNDLTNHIKNKLLQVFVPTPKDSWHFGLLYSDVSILVKIFYLLIACENFKECLLIKVNKYRK